MNGNHLKESQYQIHCKKTTILQNGIFLLLGDPELPQIYAANHANFPIQIRKITVQICGNFWVTQYHSFTLPAGGSMRLSGKLSLQDQSELTNRLWEYIYIYKEADLIFLSSLLCLLLKLIEARGLGSEQNRKLVSVVWDVNCQIFIPD